MRELVLASTSPWRWKMLTAAGLRVRAEGPGVTEELVSGADPESIARGLALQKAEAVRRRNPEALVLGADQVAWDPERGEAFGKPAHAGDHLARLMSMRGRSHWLITGFALLGPGVRHVDHEITRLWVRSDLTRDELQRYVATGEGSGCAGGYAIEGLGSFLFERIDGDWFNILGLPLLRVFDVLRLHGWRFGGAHD